MAHDAGRIGILDVSRGIDLDRLLGALLDAGWSLDGVRGAVRAAGLDPGVQVSVSEGSHEGVRGVRVSVRAREGAGPDGVPEGEALVAGVSLPETIRARAIDALRRLARAREAVRGTGGALPVRDAEVVAGIVAVAAGMASLGIARLHSGPCGIGPRDDGEAPPDRAQVLELLRGREVVWDAAGAFVTPSGAAALAAFATGGAPGRFVLDRAGVGIGHGALRLVLGREVAVDAGRTADLWQIETNVDDLNPQWLPRALDRALAAGAVDAWAAPIHMKKGRPGLWIGALVPAGLIAEVERVLFEETSTIGVRRFPLARTELPRERIEVDTPWGPVAAKRAWMGDRWKAAPEHDDALRLARERGVPLREIYEAVAASLASMRDAGPR